MLVFFIRKTYIVVNNKFFCDSTFSIFFLTTSNGIMTIKVPWEDEGLSN